MSFMAKLKPEFFIDSIYDIDGSWLTSKGIEALIIDVDNTVMARDERLPDDKLCEWISDLKDAGLKLLIISNNWSDRVKEVAFALGLSYLAPAVKPFKPAYKAATSQLGVAVSKTAIIGDQVFTDILGGNRAGMRTILVAPVSDVDLVHTKMLRVLERVLLKRLSGQLLVDRHWQRPV